MSMLRDGLTDSTLGAEGIKHLGRFVVFRLEAVTLIAHDEADRRLTRSKLLARCKLSPWQDSTSLFEAGQSARLNLSSTYPLVTNNQHVQPAVMGLLFSIGAQSHIQRRKAWCHSRPRRQQRQTLAEP